MSRKINLNPYHLIDDEVGGYGYHEESPWDSDHRGAGGFYESTCEIREAKGVGNKFPSFRKRDLNEETSGVLTLDATFKIISGDGFYFGFWGDKGDEKEAVVLRQNQGFIYAGQTSVAKADDKWHYVKLVMDIDKGMFKIHIDGKFVNELAFTGKAKTISRFVMGYEAGAVGKAHIGANMELYKNYLFCDNIVPKYDGNLPEEYVVAKEGKAKVAMRRYSQGSSYSCYYVNASSCSKTTVTRSFERSCGVVGFEMKYLLPKAGAKLTVSLLSGEETAVSVFDELTALCTKDGTLRTHSKNVWQTLRIEADTNTKTALVRLNGKVCSTIAFDNVADFVDAVEIELDCFKALEFQFAEIKAFVIPPYPADYVPEPVVPKKVGDYYVGMNICSLWREGSHYGWDCITPFPENRPLLGYYDEGVTEAADWELKWMSEHGLDFELYCWYSSEGQRPMLKTALSSEIHDGHMLAKYSDKVKMAILWEASVSRGPRSFEDLRDYIFPYFIDYFFSDPRYMQIDGNAIMSIYNPEKLINELGGPEQLKKGLEYLRKQVKKLGYKGLVVLCCGDSQPLYKEAGIDGVHCYSWNRNGYDIEFTKNRNISNIREGSVHQVPCVSMGYNDVAWAGKRYPVLEPRDMVTMLKWCKEELLDKHPDRNSWKSKLMMLSTWNEYGEGTYMMPAGVHGFGYLDALREVFCEDVPHVDIIPNQDQLDRVNLLYPKDRRLLAPWDSFVDDSGLKVLKKYEFKTKKDLEKWEIIGLTSYELRDGKLCGHSEQPNPYMILHDDEFFPVATDKISKIVAYCRTYKPVDDACCIQHSYMFEPGVWFPEQPACISIPDKVAPLSIEPQKEYKLPWKGMIYGFRFDPVWREGDFELESIVFYEAPEHKVLKIDGEIIQLNQIVSVQDGRVYIPFDTKSAVKNLPNLYYEWNHTQKKLYVFSEKNAVFTKDSDVALVDGKEVKLAKPLTFFDGLPQIEAEVLADVLGMNIEITDTEVKLTTK